MTGESVPQMKEALKPTSDPATKLQMDRQHRVNVLFSGTSLISSRRDDDSASKVPVTPDGGCLAMALRTGFNSSQGELVQMIEFSQQKVSGDSKETLMALGILLVFALVRRTCAWNAFVSIVQKSVYVSLFCCYFCFVYVVCTLVIWMSGIKHKSAPVLNKPTHVQHEPT